MTDTKYTRVIAVERWGPMEPRSPRAHQVHTSQRQGGFQEATEREDGPDLDGNQP